MMTTNEGCNNIAFGFPAQNYVTQSTDCNSPNGAIGIINQNIFLGGTGNVTWEWSGGTPGPQGIYDLSPGTYSMTTTDEEGCEGIFFLEIEGEQLWLAAVGINFRKKGRKLNT